MVTDELPDLIGDVEIVKGVGVRARVRIRMGVNHRARHRHGAEAGLVGRYRGR